MNSGITGNTDNTFNEGQKHLGYHLLYFLEKFVTLTASWHMFTMKKTHTKTNTNAKTKKGENFQEEGVHV